MEKVRAMLRRLGLELHPDKTRIVRAEDGFDFLGVHFRLCPVRKPNPKVRFSCRIWPSYRSVMRIKQRVKEVIGRRYGTSLEDMIREMNPVLRGWNNYHTIDHPERWRFLKLNSESRRKRLLPAPAMLHGGSTLLALLDKH